MNQKIHKILVAGIALLMVILPASALALSVPLDRYQIGAERTIYPTDKLLVGASSTTTNATLEVNGSFAVSTSTGGCAQASPTGIVYFTGTNCGSGGGSSFGQSWELNSSGQLAPTTTVPILVSSPATSTIANFGSMLDVTQFAGSDIYAKANTAYAYAVSHQWKNVTLRFPNGDFKNVTTALSCSTNGFRCLLQGDPAGGTTIEYTGTATSTILNSGIQSATIDHTSGCGIMNMTIVGNNYATSTSPKVGVQIGGSNGSDCTTIVNNNIQHFGYGLWYDANVYHISYENGVLRDNGQNFHIILGNNSGEGVDFSNSFIVDGANNDPFNCAFFDSFSTISTNFFGGSFDDCQESGGFQISVSHFGTHFENPGAAWGSYTYVDFGNSFNNNLNFFGGAFVNTAATPPQYVRTGGNWNFFGTFFYQSGGAVTNIVSEIGTGVGTWFGLLNNNNNSVTNIISGTPFVINGSTGVTDLKTLGIASSTPWAALSVNPNALGSNVPEFVVGSSSATHLLLKGTGELDIGTTTTLSTGAGVFIANIPFANTNNNIIPTGSAGATPQNYFNNFNNLMGILVRKQSTGTGDYFELQDSSANTKFIVKSSGNTGVGTSTPYASLSVQSGASTGDAFTVATSSGAAVFGIDNDGHRFTSGPTPIVSSCGTGSPTLTGDDQTGTVTTGTAATSCTVTFSKAYRNTPTCNFNDNSSTIPGDISSISTTQVTFALGAGLSGGSLYYQCAYHK